MRKSGQMVDDVKLACESNYPVHFYGRCGGIVPEAEEIMQKVMDIVGGVK